MRITRPKLNVFGFLGWRFRKLESLLQGLICPHSDGDESVAKLACVVVGRVFAFSFLSAILWLSNWQSGSCAEALKVCVVDQKFSKPFDFLNYVLRRNYVHFESLT